MSMNEICDTLDELLKAYKDIEKEYGLDLTYYYSRAKQVKDDILQVIWIASNIKN